MSLHAGSPTLSILNGMCKHDSSMHNGILNTIHYIEEDTSNAKLNNHTVKLGMWAPLLCCHPKVQKLAKLTHELIVQ